MHVPFSRSTRHNAVGANMISLYLDTIKLLFRREKKLYCQLREILGFYPHDIKYYKLALKHKSLANHEQTDVKAAGKKGWQNQKKLNNERLEFLGDAILGAIVADILYKKYGSEQEGFLTTLRSKIVCRNSLNRLSDEIGLSKLLLHHGDVYKSHNSYINGNAFEAFCGAIYLDRGYEYCYKFLEKEIFRKYIDIDEIDEQTTNYKSRLIEWCQKYQYQIHFTYNETRDHTGPVFRCKVFIEGVLCGNGKGYKKKASDQIACKEALQSLKRNPSLKMAIAQAVEEKHLRAQMQSQHDKTIAQMRKRKTIIFDLDGTLLDTLHDLCISTNHALISCGYPERSLEEVRAFVGNGVKLLIERAMPEEITRRRDEESKAAFERCFEAFRQHYIEHCQDNTGLYPGISELLHTLKEAGYHIAIVSNKLQAGVTELHEEWFKDTVEVAIGETEGMNRKPAPDMINKALERLGARNEDAIYIGDSEVDLQTAQNSNLPCISVLWGFRTKELLLQHGALVTAEQPKDILNILAVAQRQA